jgi:hypothetical protein
MEKKEYLLLSRGQWDSNARKEDIEAAITKFYDWIGDHIAHGRMKAGSRLTTERAVASKEGFVIDSAFCEGKEIIGGYWFIVASSLREAAEYAAQNPCAAFGLTYEIRPLDPAPCSAFANTNETPNS